MEQQAEPMSSRKEARIRWAILQRVKKNLAKGGDNFRWIGFVRKPLSRRP